MLKDRGMSSPGNINIGDWTYTRRCDTTGRIWTSECKSGYLWLLSIGFNLSGWIFKLEGGEWVFESDRLSLIWWLELFWDFINGQADTQIWDNTLHSNMTHNIIKLSRSFPFSASLRVIPAFSIDFEE